MADSAKKTPKAYTTTRTTQRDRPVPKTKKSVRPHAAKPHEGKRKDTSWSRSGDWYDSIVGEKGHFYHQELIIPKLLELLHLSPGDSLLDVGCGQGVFSRHIPQEVSYLGIDLAAPLIQQAKAYNKKSSGRKSASREFIVHDATQKPWPVPNMPQEGFSHAVCILALQNMADPETVFHEIGRLLKKGGKAIIVLNHPYFRIPRQSRWGFDEKTKTQTREVFSYMTPHEIPIITHPGKSHTAQETTWSYHLPLMRYSQIAHKAGLAIELIEEWCSPKVSYGSHASWENRARKEFPLFMALILRKLS